jgi:hypothetical protein
MNTDTEKHLRLIRVYLCPSVVPISGVCMKLNFWQWLGVALLVVGLILALNKYAFHWW